MLKRENHIEIDRRKFYKTVLALVVPMALQNLINVGVTAADVIMLGAVGEKALSGASLAGQIQYIMTLFLFGLTSGATVLTAQYWGKGDRDAIEKILADGASGSLRNSKSSGLCDGAFYCVGSCGTGTVNAGIYKRSGCCFGRS